MRALYALLIVFACVLQAAAEDPFTVADALLQQHHEPSHASGPVLTLDEAEQRALAVNPEIRVAARQLALEETRVPLAGALDDPSLSYRGWGVPFRQPWNYNAAQNMFMIGQTFPGFGKRGLRTEIARGDVAEAKAALDNVKLDIQVRVRKAFYDLLRAQDELRIHDDHVGIARQAVEAARIKYTVGKVPQQDILKAQVALTRLAEHLIHFEQDAEIARARLNTLLARDPATPIEVGGDYSVPAQLPDKDSLQKLALASRPDLAQIRAAIEKSRQEQALAAKSYAPDVTLAGGYMLMPGGSKDRNSYMVEASITLPWFNRGRHDAEIAEARAKVSEQDARLSAIQNIAFGQIQEALAQVRAAKRLADVYQNGLRPQAEATLRSTVIAYENDHTDFLNLLDSQTAVIDIDLAYFQALADFETRFADLELATGSPIERTAQPALTEGTK
jgi:outer membrane protein, heavy metal efflux system